MKVITALSEEIQFAFAVLDDLSPVIDLCGDEVKNERAISHIETLFIYDD